MIRTGVFVAVVGLAAAAVWAGVAVTAQDPKPAADAKPADLTALREAVAAAATRGENVDEIRTALAALEKALPAAKAGTVPPELQALRNAVDAAAKTGENVATIEKELAAVETAVAGKSLAKPKPVAPPAPRDDRLPPPEFDRPVPFPALPNMLDLPRGRGIDVEAFQKAMDLRQKALELMAKNPRDPEAQKLLAEATQQMLKAARPGLGGADVMPLVPLFPDFNRAAERPRLGIRLEALNAVTADQLGLEPGVGVAVTGVLPGTPAEQAGLKVHDVIVEFAGKPAGGTADEFIRQVSAAKAGEKLTVVVLRKGKRIELKGVVLPDVGRDDDNPLPRNPRAVPEKVKD